MASSNVIDTLGRTPVTVAQSGNQTFLDYLCEQGCNPSGGDRARITVNIDQPSSGIQTQFNQSGVAEYSSGAGLTLRNIVFPDGSSYSFTFDSYGMITGMTLPTGGQISYGYTNFADYSGNVNRWVTSRTVDGQTWTFNPAQLPCSTAPCPMQVTVTTPPYNDGTVTASDNRVYTFLVDNAGWLTAGALNNQIQYFRGSTSGTPLVTENIDYGNIPGGGTSPVKIRDTLTWPTPSGTLNKKTEYGYDGFSNVTATKQWDYQPSGNFGASPDRETDNVFKTDSAYVNANILRLIQSTTVKNSSGTQLAQTNYGYDENTVQSSGVTIHRNTPSGPRGNLTSINRWLGPNNVFVTNGAKRYDTGEVYQSIDPATNTATYTYDSVFAGAYPTKVCNALGQCSYNGYDSNTGLMTSFTDANGSSAGDQAHTTTHTYDTLFRPLCIAAPDGGQTCLSYPSVTTVQKTTKITATINDVSSVTVDGLGRPTQTQHTVPGGTAKVDTTYDPIGRVSSVSNPYFSTSDPTYAITQSQYDAFGRVTQTMRPDGSVSRVSYSANCITTTDETGRPRTNCKNVFGKLVEVDEPNAASTGTNATASTVISGSLLTVNSVVDSGTVSLTSGGFTATACYGNSTNSFCVNKPVNSTAAQVTSALASALNAPGSPISATASGATLNLIWNTPGPYYPSVSALATAHDQPGLFTNPSFTSPATMFDHGTGPSLSTNPYVTLYQYDALGNLLCVEQHGDVAPGTPGATGCSSPASSDPTSPWRVRRFTYDSLSRLLTTANPESGTISYFYDTNGNLLQKVSPSPNQTGSAQHTVSYCYDALNRVNGKAYSWQNCQSGQLPQGTAVVSYTYDQGANGVGRLTGLADQAGAASYSHDAIGRISSESRTINGVPNNISKNMSYTYNLDGSINTVTYPSTAVITYAPDSAGRAKSAIDIANSINYVTSATYGPHNALTSFVSGQNAGFNGITNTTVYDVRLQPCRMTASKLGSAPTNCDNSFGELLDLRYKYDLWIGDNGNVTQITNYRDQTRNQAFTYDPLNRLASAQSLGTDCNATVLGGKAKFWGNSYSYDAWGNLLTKIPTKCSAENLNGTVNFRNQLQGGYTYDAAGNMMHDATTNLDYAYDLENRVATAGGFTYIYDADGNRVKKINGTTGTLYWYTTLGIVAESDLAGNLQSEYIFFDGQRVARKDLTGNAVSYYFSDHLKTASVITDSTGNIKAESDYYPWGGELQFINNDSNRYKFTGKERDAESGLDDFGARYYSSPLGRFVTPDPSAMVPRNLAPQELNLYEYAVDSPTRYIDPDGKAPLDSKIITTLSNFYRVVKTEMMPKLAHDYVDKGGMPKNASPELQDGIRGFVMFGADPSYPMSLRYYNYEDAVEGYVAQGITDQVNAWLADPTTTSDDLAAALVTLSGLEHESDAPEAIGFFSEWIGRVDKVLKKAGGSGARNNLVKRLTKAVEDAKKKKEKEEEEAKKKKAEECKKDKTKC